ncbi:MAG: hypothetical protein N2C12_03720, partial [Planctomycetales bacterium]
MKKRKQKSLPPAAPAESPPPVEPPIQTAKVIPLKEDDAVDLSPQKKKIVKSGQQTALPAPDLHAEVAPKKADDSGLLGLPGFEPDTGLPTDLEVDLEVDVDGPKKSDGTSLPGLDLGSAVAPRRADGEVSQSSKSTFSKGAKYYYVSGGLLLLLAVIATIFLWPDGSTETEVVNDGEKEGQSPSETGDNQGSGNKKSGGGLSAASVLGPDGNPCENENGWWMLRSGKKNQPLGTFQYVATSSAPKISGFRIEWIGKKNSEENTFTLIEVEAFTAANSQIDAADFIDIADARIEPPLASSTGKQVIDRNFG